MIEDRAGVICGSVGAICLTEAAACILIGSRTMRGAGAETFAHDASGRLITHINDLCAVTQAELLPKPLMTTTRRWVIHFALVWTGLKMFDSQKKEPCAPQDLLSGDQPHSTRSPPTSFVGDRGSSLRLPA